MQEEKQMQQPNEVVQRQLNDVIEDKPEEIGIAGTKKKVKVGWLKPYTLRRLTDVMLSQDVSIKEESKILCKNAALIVLNSFFKIKFFYPILWRWYYYVKEYQPEQLIPIVECGKKKVPQVGYYLNTISLTSMKDTVMQMTRKEVEATLLAQSSAKRES